jgi:hypothetical protein
LKKFSVILLIGLYVFLSAGLSIKLHYCGGALSGIELFGERDDCECGKASRSHCCTDKTIDVKAPRDIVTVKSVTQAKSFFCILPARLVHYLSDGVGWFFSAGFCGPVHPPGILLQLKTVLLRN